MSLILGIPLNNRIYLVSDSRVTEGSSYSDNCAKWNNLNRRLCVLGAGHLEFAAFLIRGLRKEINKNDTFHELELLLKNSLFKLAQEYYSESGSYQNSAALIFGGYDPTLKKKTTAARFGEIISNPLVNKGDGTTIEQVVDTKYFKAIKDQFDSNPQSMLRGDTVLEIDTPRPRCVAVKIHMPSINENRIDISWEESELWESISFHPNWNTERVQLPIEIVANLDFGEAKGDETIEEQAFKAHEQIINSIEKILSTRDYKSVGGNLVPILITQEGEMTIATGSLAKKRNPNQIIGGLQVINNKLNYFDTQGKLHPYENIIEIDDSSLKTAII